MNSEKSQKADQPGRPPTEAGEDRAVTLLKQVSTAALSGMLFKKYNMRTRAVQNVRPLNDQACRFVGPAYTIRYVPQREDLQIPTDLGTPGSLLLRATEELRRGEVFVIDMQRNTGVGALGDVLVTQLIAAGVAGVVADGGMRDVGDLREMGLPIFCSGPAAPPGPMTIMPAGLQELVACGGVGIFPGDYVVGDEDGVMVVPAHLGVEVAEQCIEKQKMDGWSRRKVLEKGGVRGVYPPSPELLAEYKAWAAANADDKSGSFSG